MKDNIIMAGAPERSTVSQNKAFIIAWAFCLIFYFLEYVIRSSPAVMINQLAGIFKRPPLGVSSILGTYYYSYSITSLIAGVLLDRAGAKYPLAFGTAILCTGCLLFAIPNAIMGDAGRLLQGAGSAFAFTGCVYLASHGFAAKHIATAIGFTQCVGMLGGSAGQFVTGPLLNSGLSVTTFWIAVGIICGIICLLLFFSTPEENKVAERKAAVRNILIPYQIVFSNLQSYLSGLISGLLFAPTTIFAMTWGVTFFEHDRGYSYSHAVMTCSMVPLGWVLGAPLLGWISDRIGRRKPVLIGGILVMLISFAQLSILPDLCPSIISMLIFGIASGAAMIPYSIIKEANPDNVKGSATGGINFLTFGVTAVLGPIFSNYFGKTLMTTTDHLGHFKSAGTFLLVTISIALFTSIIVKETGKAARVN